MLTNEALAELERLEREATPAPWRRRPSMFDDWGLVRGGDNMPVLSTAMGCRYSQEDLGKHNGPAPIEENAEFVAAIRNNARALIAAAKEREDLAEKCAALIDENEHAAKRVAELEAFNSELATRAAELEVRLPRTADGVPVVPGQRVYGRIGDAIEEVEIQYPRPGVYVGMYSTREAAEAARETR